MTRLLLRLYQGFFTAEVMGVALVLIALQLFIEGLASSLRNTDTDYFFLASLLALLLGLGLAKWDSKPIQASAGIAAAGVAGVWVIGARLAVPLIQWMQAVASVVPHLLPAIRTGSPVDTAPVREAWSVIVQASGALALRFQTWTMGFDANVRVNDALIRNLVWLLGLWLLAAWMGWFTARRNALAALLPAILAAAFVVSYSERRVELIWGLVFVLLLLMGVWNYRNHTHQWETHRIDFSDSIRYDNTQAVLALAMLVGTVAFVTPSISWRAIRDYFNARNQNPVAEALGVQPQPVRPVGAPTQQPALPRDHLLTGGFANSEKIVMTVRTGELPPMPDIAQTRDAPRYYWRSVVYDKYVGAGWVTSNAAAQRYDPDTPLIPGLLRGYKPVHLEVQLAQPEGRLFWTGTLFSADVPVTVEWRLRPTSNLFADQSALLQADMFAATTSAVAYTAEAYAPLVTVDALRLAPAEYPEEIRARYLQLPRDTPDRVLKLAADLTAGLTNPYDKAKAIEAHLRANYPYDLAVPAPPPSRDVAEYFLFELKKGYCDYYATAMVVLARLNGVPARFVSGYAPGSYDAPNARYIVRELNAHSWAEVYFPEIGWVEFEPTAAIPEIARDPSAGATPPAAGADNAASQLLTRFRLAQLSTILAPVAALLMALLLYFTWIERWWVLRLSPAAAVERIYRKVYRAGRPLLRKEPASPSETAHEFAQKLIAALGTRQAASRLKRFFAGSLHEIDALTDRYYSALFRQVEVRRHDAHAAWRLWSRLRWRLWLARMMTY